MEKIKAFLAGGQDLTVLVNFRAHFAMNLLALADALGHLLYLVLAAVLLPQAPLLPVAAAVGFLVCAAAFLMNRLGFGPKDAIHVMLTVELGLSALLWMWALGFDCVVPSFVLCGLVPHYLFTDLNERLRVALIWFLILCMNGVVLLGIFAEPVAATPHMRVFAAISFFLVFDVVLLELALNNAGVNMAMRFYEGSIASAKDDSMTDPLTGLRNRRYLQVTEAEYAEHAKAMPCAVALFDLDFFKRVNDRYGHGVGDALLQHFSRLLQGCFRTSDLCLRWGGEEFVMVFLGANAGQAAKMIEDFRAKVEAAPLVTEGLTVPFTFTAGVCDVGPDGAVLAAVDRADLLLYAGKNSGRDRVVLEGAKEGDC